MIYEEISQWSFFGEFRNLLFLSSILVEAAGRKPEAVATRVTSIFILDVIGGASP